jgi:hypothetical protein
MKNFAKNGTHNNRKKNTNILDKKYGLAYNKEKKGVWLLC